MDAQTQEKLKDINRRFEFYQRLDGTGTLFAGQYVEDLDCLLKLVHEQETGLCKVKRMLHSIMMVSQSEKCDENIPDDKEEAYELGYTDAVVDIHSRIDLAVLEND